MLQGLRVDLKNDIGAAVVVEPADLRPVAVVVAALGGFGAEVHLERVGLDDGVDLISRKVRHLFLEAFPKGFGEEVNGCGEQRGLGRSRDLVEEGPVDNEGRVEGHDGGSWGKLLVCHQA